ncbi:MAG: NAD-dependent epimerase/dehydratase family protein, partial [Vicinamibacteraceae bacterium]
GSLADSGTDARVQEPRHPPESGMARNPNKPSWQLCCTAGGMPSERPLLLVTGSSGRIGSAVLERFAPTYQVVGIDRVDPPEAVPEADYRIVDLTSDERVASALTQIRAGHGSHIASVVHLAAYYDFSGEPSPKYEQVTVRGTERLLRALHPFEVEQFVFSSSMLVHAPTEPGRLITEDSPLVPRWPYPESKMSTETIVRAQHDRMPFALLRIAGVYDDECHSIPLANQIQRIDERRVTGKVFPGHAAHGQAFLHVDDLVDALARVVERRATLPDDLVLLLGEPETLSYDELQHTLGRLIHGEEWTTREIPKSVAKAGAWTKEIIPGEDPFIKPWMIDFADDHYALDVSRARALLDWEPRRSLRETLPTMVAKLKENADSWYRENGLKS